MNNSTMFTTILLLSMLGFIFVYEQIPTNIVNLNNTKEVGNFMEYIERLNKRCIFTLSIYESDYDNQRLYFNYYCKNHLKEKILAVGLWGIPGNIHKFKQWKMEKFNVLYDYMEGTRTIIYRSKKTAFEL